MFVDGSRSSHPRAAASVWATEYVQPVWSHLLVREVVLGTQRGMLVWTEPDVTPTDFRRAGASPGPAMECAVEPFVPLLLFNCTTARPQCGGNRIRAHGEKYVVVASASEIRNALLRPLSDDLFARPNHDGEELETVPHLRRAGDD